MNFTKDELISTIKVMSTIDSNFDFRDIVDWFCRETEVSCDDYDKAIEIACKNIADRIGLQIVQDEYTVKYKSNNMIEFDTLDENLFSVADSIEKLNVAIIYNDHFIADSKDVGIEIVEQLFNVLDSK